MSDTVGVIDIGTQEGLKKYAEAALQRFKREAEEGKGVTPGCWGMFVEIAKRVSALTVIDSLPKHNGRAWSDHTQQKEPTYFFKLDAGGGIECWLNVDSEKGHLWHWKVMWNGFPGRWVVAAEGKASDPETAAEAAIACISVAKAHRDRHCKEKA